MHSSPLQTEEELLLVKEAAILPYMFDVLERDIAMLRQAALKLPEPYIARLQAAQNRVLERQLQLKQLFRQGDIRIIEARRTEFSLQVEYKCRGYTHRMELLWEIVRADIEIRLADELHIDLNR
ncbi:hypothetical protein Q5741_02230 [Paenibacillus sp. JX-17]|uniref:Uncharacterized protein n=1 Tax=Paenibacillus lacisoli TaxID=3064525 RepID=A0ABT9C8J7_9BACL|nr:hypothetical protein [Paenibacillus sp. JX-17]MDO7905230.1 hypothetical protein [Paenibacillus sp. JX-17]